MPGITLVSSAPRAAVGAGTDPAPPLRVIEAAPEAPGAACVPGAGAAVAAPPDISVSIWSRVSGPRR